MFDNQSHLSVYTYLLQSLVASTSSTRSSDFVWLIGFLHEQLTGAQLPSGRSAMCNIIYYHCSKNLPICDNASAVYDQLMTFWLKAQLPIYQKHHIIIKKAGLYQEYKCLIKHLLRKNEKNKINQDKYSEKLEMMFEMNHAQANQKIKIDKAR